MLESLRSNENLRRQCFALRDKLRELQGSTLQSERRKAWKLAGKIRAIENEMASRQMLLFSGRL